MTNKTHHTVGYVRDHPKRSVAAQRALMARHGVAKVYADLALCIRQRRKGAGDVVAVAWLPLVADPKRRTVAGGLRAAMLDAIRDLDRAGATVMELETMRSTSDASQREAMILDAIDALARTRVGVRSPGRPSIVWTADQQRTMREHWRSRDHATDRAAHAAIRAAGVPASISQVRKVCGKSGRSPGGSRRKPKQQK